MKLIFYPLLHKGFIIFLITIKFYEFLFSGYFISFIILSYLQRLLTKKMNRLEFLQNKISGKAFVYSVPIGPERKG
jgi:hypothetical protein